MQAKPLRIRASMRPRLIAVDNGFTSAATGAAAGASMRPRLIAVDNSASTRLSKTQPTSFNEATADCRG